jgi:molybdenum cofactor biosynthesis enzyme MoaA
MTTTTAQNTGSNSGKNRSREAPSFANLNLLGRCNVNCFFCLGKDIEAELSGQNQLGVPFQDWKNFWSFLGLCKQNGIEKLYITGQNTDSLLYRYLWDLVRELHQRDFQVGLRTNGYLALKNMDAINQCELSTGYSIHSLDPRTNRLILGREDIPPWPQILKITQRPRVQIVVTRYNEHEIMKLLRWLEQYPNVRYIQVRRVSTDTRLEELRPDIEAYTRVYDHVNYCFGPPLRTLWGDADVYQIHGHEVVFWRTVKTTVNSFNYFTDGTISAEYFVVEGYLKNCDKKEQ